jgi:hypothetical protein
MLKAVLIQFQRPGKFLKFKIKTTTKLILNNGLSNEANDFNHHEGVNINFKCDKKLRESSKNVFGPNCSAKSPNDRDITSAKKLRKCSKNVFG